MDVRLVRGRELVARDSGAAVTPLVITSDFAAEVFGDADPVGQRLPALTWKGDRRIGDVEIVGVVATADVGSNPIGSATRVYAPMYGALAVVYPKPDALLIRTQGPAAPLVATFEKIAHDVAPMLPVRSMKTLAEVDDSQRSEILAAASASAAGGGLTLILASIGLYAVVALSVQQRRREIGVRVSLGARPGQVVAMFFGSGLRVSLAGLVIGLPLSAAALKIVSSQVGIPRTNVTAIAAAVTMVVVVVASLASWIPARRAAGVDPLIALRDG
jgi:ABC-type antimicrobial peptide transport system permease subunit